MGLLKSLFVFVAPVLLILIVVQGVLIGLDSNNLILSVGVGFSTLPLFFLSYIMLFRKLSRVDKYLLAVSLPAIIGFFLVLLGCFNNTSLALTIFAVLIVLVFFYRGNWCLLCMAQIDEVVSAYQKFKENNIDVIFISPQSSKNTKNLTSKFNLDFQFYIDKNNKVARQLGILHKFGLPMGFQVLCYESHSVYPTIIAVDEKGVILYCD